MVFKICYTEILGSADDSLKSCSCSSFMMKLVNIFFFNFQLQFLNLFSIHFHDRRRFNSQFK